MLAHDSTHWKKRLDQGPGLWGLPRRARFPGGVRRVREDVRFPVSRLGRVWQGPPQGLVATAPWRSRSAVQAGAIGLVDLWNVMIQPIFDEPGRVLIDLCLAGVKFLLQVGASSD